MMDFPLGENVKADRLAEVTSTLKSLLSAVAPNIVSSWESFSLPTFIVWPWEDAPAYVHGFDPAWEVFGFFLGHDDPVFVPTVPVEDFSDAGHEPDVYILDGIVVYVGSH
jgi:hypothetical protein